MTAARDGLPPRTVEVNGVKLVAEELPSKEYRGDRSLDVLWGDAVAKFLTLGEESMRIEKKGQPPKQTYASLARYLKTRNERRVYAAVRRGTCYMVRVPVKGARG